MELLNEVDHHFVPAHVKVSLVFLLNFLGVFFRFRGLRYRSGSHWSSPLTLIKLLHLLNGLSKHTFFLADGWNSCRQLNLLLLLLLLNCFLNDDFLLNHHFHLFLHNHFHWPLNHHFHLLLNDHFNWFFDIDLPDYFSGLVLGENPFRLSRLLLYLQLYLSQRFFSFLQFVQLEQKQLLLVSLLLSHFLLPLPQPCHFLV